MNSSDDYGETYIPDTLSNGSIKYTISLNKDLLIKCSQEWVADTYLHELIHAYLGTQNYQFGTNAQHQQMAYDFLDKMANTLLALFPSFPPLQVFFTCKHNITLMLFCPFALAGVEKRSTTTSAVAGCYHLPQTAKHRKLLGFWLLTCTFIFYCASVPG